MNFRPSCNKLSSPALILERIQRLSSTDLHFTSPDEIASLLINRSRRLSRFELELFLWPEQPDFLPSTKAPEQDKIHLIFGSGLAKNQKDLSEKSFSDLFILEPDPGLLCFFLGMADPEKIFPGARLHFFYNLENCLTKIKEVHNFWRSISALKLSFCVERNPEIAARLQRELDLCNAIAGEENKTIEKHYFTWAANENQNLNQLFFRPHASFLNERYKEIPAILIGAGPSLPGALPTLRNLHDKQRCLIVASSTALRSLAKTGIVPDLTIIIEGKKQAHFDDLGADYLSKLNLLAALKTHPGHLDHNFREIYWFHNQTSPLFELIAKTLPQTSPLNSGGNVINEALQFVLAAGCNPVILSGCDLAFTRGAKYAVGLEKKEGEDEAAQKRFFTVPSDSGEPLSAPTEFIAYARSLEEIVDHQKKINDSMTFINISTGGRELAGCRPMTPDNCIDYLSGIPEREKPYLPGHHQSKPGKIPEKLQLHALQLKQLEALVALIINKTGPQSLQVDFIPVRYFLTQLPEFESGIALSAIPWLRRLLLSEQIVLEDLQELWANCRKLTRAAETGKSS